MYVHVTVICWPRHSQLLLLLQYFDKLFGMVHSRCHAPGGSSTVVPGQVSRFKLLSVICCKANKRLVRHVLLCKSVFRRFHGVGVCDFGISLLTGTACG